MKELIYKKDAIKALTIYLNYIYMGLTGKPLSADKCRDAAEGVIGQLPTVQPTQTNCEYCHTDRDGYVFPLEKNSHAFIDHDKIVLKANGWRGEAKIKYCPICGRRLTDGTD